MNEEIVTCSLTKTKYDMMGKVHIYEINIEKYNRQNKNQSLVMELLTLPIVELDVS